MKNLLLISFAIFSTITWGQIMTDSFNDGDFTNNPTWTGNTAEFIVNTNQKLQLNSSGSSSSYLSTAHNLTQLTDRLWEFKAKYSFSPSGNNYGLTYLTAINSDLSTDPDGIYIQIGESGSNDAIRLFERSGGTETEILHGNLGVVASSFDISVRVIHRANGDWELYTDLLGGSNYSFITKVNYTTAIIGQYIGVNLTYTSSNATGMEYDDFIVDNAPVDNTPPTVDTAYTISSTQVEVLFSEPVDQTTSEFVANYSIDNGIGQPNTAQRNATDQTKVTLTFATAFTVGQSYILSTNNIEDLHGNTMSALQTTNLMYVVAQTPIYGDIIINEFMADPTPSVGLPSTEFVEIYNRSSKYFNLKDWKLKDNSSAGTLPDVWLFPNEYLVLIPSAATTDYPQGAVVSSWSSLNNGGDEIHLVTDSDLTVDALSYDNTWYKDGTKEDGGWTIERINPTIACSGIDNWKASVSPTGGTPGTQNSVYSALPDTQNPTVTDAAVIAPNQLQLTFSEPIDSISLEAAVFSSNPSLTVSNLIISESYVTQIIIEFSNNLSTGVLYSFTFGSFSDCSGNSDSYSGTFVLPGIPSKGDIIINEILFNPHTGEADFVELYNKSSKYIDLKGWELARYYNQSVADNSPIVTNYVLAPNDYVVITEDSSSQLSNYPATVSGKLIQLSSLPSYYDDTSTVLLFLNTTLMDEVSYTEEWYQDPEKTDGGWSIELINPALSCSGKNNWRASINPAGATPGGQNSVYSTAPDTQKPIISNVIVQPPQRITFIFSENVDSVSLANAVFNSTPSLTISSRIINGAYTDQLELIFNSPLSTGQVYSYSLTDFMDCSGNTNSYNGSFVLPQTPEKGDLIINEILFNPNTGGSDFVEIYNKSTKYIDLNGMALANFDDGTIDNKQTINQQYILHPNDFVVIAKDSNYQFSTFPSAVSGKMIELSNLPSYNDDSSTVYLLRNDTIYDKVSYTEKWYRDPTKSGGGWSIERMNPDFPCGGPINWKASNHADGATPGFINSVYSTAPDTIAPTISNIYIDENQALHIHFSEGMDSLSLANATFSVTPSLAIDSTFIHASFPAYMIVYFSDSLLPGELHTFTLTGFADCSGNSSEEQGVFVVAQQPQKGDLIINEILFNPFTGGADFIEIYNNSDKYIEMKDWGLANYDNGIADIEIIDESYILSPEDYVVITKDANFQLMNYPVAVPGKFIEIASLPNYNNDSSTVFLLLDSTVMDKVSYTEEWHFKLLQDYDGVSLERYTPNPPSNDPANWHSASQDVGFATPGRVNSQNMQPGEGGGTLTLSSSIISPDNDGHEDALILSYEINSPEYIGDLVVYDDKGRKIKVLFADKTLGSKGIASWDGTRENGLKASIGPYIIIFSLFNIEKAKVQTIKKVVTVASKL